MTTMLILMLGLSFITLSGCGLIPKKSIYVGGAEDFIRIPKGTAIRNVPLPTDESKTYTVITPKDGFWISLDGDSRTWV